MVVMAFKIAGSRAARQPHVIYQFAVLGRTIHDRDGKTALPQKVGATEPDDTGAADENVLRTG